MGGSGSRGNMGTSYVVGPSGEAEKHLARLLALELARDRWFWRVVGLVVSTATVTQRCVLGLGLRAWVAGQKAS